MIRTRAVGSERFLVWMTSTNEAGDLFEWCVSHEDSKAAADSCVVYMQAAHVPGFASSYRIERVVVIVVGEEKPFVGLAQADPPSEGPAPAPEPIVEEDPW
jgi:hypothetical protein